MLEWVRMVSELCSWLATEQQESPRLGSRPTARDFPQHLSISSLHQDFRDTHCLPLCDTICDKFSLNCGPRVKIERLSHCCFMCSTFLAFTCEKTLVSQITFFSGSVTFLSNNLCVTLSEICSADELVVNIFGEEFLK